jgi:hypothetical protein
MRRSRSFEVDFKCQRSIPARRAPYGHLAGLVLAIIDLFGHMPDVEKATLVASDELLIEHSSFVYSNTVILHIHVNVTPLPSFVLCW